MKESEINITYETLYELRGREKNREDIQELSSTFFDDLKDYLNSKKQMLIGDDSRNLTPEQLKKAQVQLDNIKKILKELYEKRERKIINLALTRSRTGSDILETERLLGVESELYQELWKTFDRYRKNVLLKIIEGELPEVVGPCKRDESVSAEQEVLSEKESPTEESMDSSKDTLMVRFLKPVPKFVGKELETYGPFDTDDIVTLPIKIVQVLIKKERAEEITAE